MTRTGKCDMCRSRKVKCDEQKPKCGACSKRDRDCTYSFGKPSAFVLEDPTQLSKHGKPKVAPVIYPLREGSQSTVTPVPSAAPSPPPDPSPSTSLTLRQTTSRDADTGSGVFMTLSVPMRDKNKVNKRTLAQQKRRLQLYLGRLEASFEPRLLLPSQTALAARYLNLLSPYSPAEQPFMILGSWIESLPSRIGRSPAVDLAVEYLINSYDVYQNATYSNHCMALSTKSKALKELQLAVSNEETRRSYDTALATKIHFIAEVFMGIMNLYHAIHAAGLSDILQAGPVTDADDEHFWSFLDNTYFDDVTEAMVASRTSVYDHKVYLDMTKPEAIPIEAPSTFRASVALMHVFIQVPRLICLIRHVSSNPEDSRTLGITIALAQSLWELVPNDIMQNIIQDSVITVDSPPAPEIADLIPNSYHFSSIEMSTLIGRYWKLQVCLCGTIQTLYRNFPAECASSLLPPLSVVEETDVHAATELARCIHYAVTVCPSLPLVPLRIYTTFQVSFATWHRLTRRTTASSRSQPPFPDPSVTAFLDDQLSRAKRMEQFVSDESNKIHQMWNIQRVNKRFLRAAAIDMAGGPIPDWMPIRVKFESEDGTMVMKMEYDVGGPVYDEIYGNKNGHQGWVRTTKTLSPFDPGTRDQQIGKGFPTGGNGKIPKYLYERFGDEPAKYWGYTGSPEQAFTKDLSGKVTGSVPEFFEDQLSESEDEDF